MSGHMFFADNYGYDDAIYASARLLQVLSKGSASLSTVVDDIPKYYSTPEIRVPCSEDDKFNVVEDVKVHFQRQYDTIDIDGVRVLFGDGWGLIRASNTQPILVMRCEARTQARLEEIEGILTAQLKTYPSVKL